MKFAGKIAGVVVVGLVVIAMRGCLSKKDPDERLSARIAKLCDIARSNIDTPSEGVHSYGAYLGDHFGDMLGEFGDTIAEIEKIQDEAKHDDRARLARERLHAHQCSRDSDKFWRAVDADRDARAELARFNERLNRTFEILLGGRPLDARGVVDYWISNL
jgi:hypothetical protein